MSVHPGSQDRPVFASKQATRRILVCGGRDYWNYERVREVLGQLHREEPIRYLIHGNANGADRLGRCWALGMGVQEIACPAEWSKHGKRAGPIRNQNMLGHNPSLVVAFPGGAGTRDMVKRAERAGISVLHVQNAPAPDDGRSTGHEGGLRDEPTSLLSALQQEGSGS